MQGWTSAFTAQSVLVQLQAFLLADDLLFDTSKVTAEMAVSLAQEFVCTDCAHCERTPNPSFQPLPGLRPRTKIHVLPPVLAHLPRPTVAAPLPSKRPNAVAAAPVAPVAKMPAKPPTPTLSPVGATAAAPLGMTSKANEIRSEPKGGWITVTRKRTASLPPPEPKFMRSVTCGRMPDLAAVIPVPGADYVEPQSRAQKKRAAKAEACQRRKLAAAEKGTTSVDHPPEIQAPLKIADEWRSVPLACKCAPAPQEHSAADCHRAHFVDPSERLKALEGKSAKELIVQVRTAFENPTSECLGQSLASGHGSGDHQTEETGMSIEAMGLLALLGPGILSHILCHERLPLAVLGRLSCCCRALRNACNDGYLWRQIMHRHFPTSALVAARRIDWKHVYMLEHNNVLGSLVCFHTKLSFHEDILGLPIKITVNPKTKRVDYALPYLDCISASAFYKEGVRLSAENEPVDTFLPLYITREHFDRSIPLIEKAAVVMCPHMGQKFVPGMIPYFMSVLQTTMVVLLSDKGVSASEKAMDGYCSLHRLFMALVEHYHLIPSIEGEVLRFVKDEASRTKERCPNLGNFASLLSVCCSSATTWEKVLPAMLTESFNRSILWMCSRDATLASRLKRRPMAGGDADMELLASVMQVHKVSLRLWMFHASFLALVARPASVSSAQVAYEYDCMYGRPSAASKSRFRAQVLNILQVKTWPEFFTRVGVRCMTPASLTAILRQSWINSLSLGYHDRWTDFSKVQRSGVSTLLMKGESYSAAPNMRHLKLEEHWRWQDATKFLDASALVFSADGQHLGTVDYSRRSSLGVRHSGDVLDHGNRSGAHTIDVDLRRLPSAASAIYFTISAWADAMLTDIRLPHVAVADGEGNPLCEYHIEGTAKFTGMKSVVMCRLVRSANSRWSVEAIGNIGQGDAQDYGPLLSFCSGHMLTGTSEGQVARR